MSLCSLKKSTPSAKREESVTVDSFIEEAIAYASGKDVIRHLYPVSCDNDLQVQPPVGPMRRATFTLTQDAIDQLAELSEQTGICRSRLIRIWIDQHCHGDVTTLLTSKTP